MLGDDESEAARVVPSELVSSRMRACMSCSLVKSLNQFIAYGCENCPFMDYENDRERVAACTTPAFTGLYVTTKPKESWVAKWQRTSTMIPGAYAISIEAQMPEDIYEQLTENNLRPHRILATAEKADADD